MGYNRAMRVRLTEVYLDWINGLRDRSGRARIQVRVDRLVHGNPGDHRNLAGGISELRIDIGPGYRVYYTQRGNELIVLLAGGDKSSQQQDIRRAIELAESL
jgi:putative addiction module killer protein